VSTTNLLLIAPKLAATQSYTAKMGAISSKLGVGMMKVPMSPPSIDEILAQGDYETLRRIFRAGIKASQNGQYRHWDEIRHRPPPKNLSTEEWWFAIKLARQQEYHSLPLVDEAGTVFRYMMPDKVWERVHKMDQRLAGQIILSEEVTNPSTRDRYLVNSLIEEAINSSQLEGANTSKQVAKDMLKSGRPPRDRSERMILNNYEAMNFVRENRTERLTPEFVREIHALVTDRTLDNPPDAGRLQEPGDDRVKVWSSTGELLHEPPPAEQLPWRLNKLCRFANGQELETFLHPVVRSIILHFWLAYDHPFVDGNGRTARILFYWSMLSQGYWLAEFLAISRIIQGQRSRYERSFLYTETDGLDLTYFITEQSRVIMKAVSELEGYLQRKMAEVKRTEKMMKSSAFNHRQIALLSHALRHPDQAYTVKSHSQSHNIVPETARTDLLGLVEKNLLSKQKIGKAFAYVPTRDLGERLQDV
jgi:Fic family protein